MTATVETFRAAYPEFAAVKYPDATVAFWLGQAQMFVNSARWGDSNDLGVMLWTAHNLALKPTSQPGRSKGLLSSKSAGGVSAGYDHSTGSEEGAGYWNLTTYGAQFFRMSNLFGAGPLQIGTDGGQVYGGAIPGFPF